MATERIECPNCKREFVRGITWKGSNYCRGLFLMDQGKNSPGLSGWELSELTGLPYRDTVRGLERARDYDAIEARAEDKENGGIRYRYWPYPDHSTRRDAMAQKRKACYGRICGGVKNIYQVVSEELIDYYSIGIPEEVPEPYCIAELVVSEKRSQAGLLAWKTSRDYSKYGPDITERPRMSIRVVKKDVDLPVGVVTHYRKYRHLWRG